MLQIEVRQFPVTVHFNKHTPGYDKDGNYDQYAYLNEACSKVSICVATKKNLHLCSKLRNNMGKWAS